MAMDDNKSNGIVKNRALRLLLLVCGWVLVGLAALGLVLPLIPTTPFLLVAAACFYRSSNRFYNWLMTNKLFGKYIRDFTNKKGIPLKVKLGALLFLWTSLLVSAFVFVSILWVQILLIGIGFGVSIHILLIKTKR